MTIDELRDMHAELLQQASSALSSTEEQVSALRGERQQAAVVGIRTAGDAAPGLPPIDAALQPSRRGGLCPSVCSGRTICTIL